MASKIQIADAKLAIDSENNELAFSILSQYLLENRNDADGWLLMAQVAKEPQQIIDCLERVAILRPDIGGLRERLERVKSGPLKYYNQIFEVIRGYGQWTGEANELGTYAVNYEIKNDVNEIKELLDTTKKQQRHLQELQKLMDRDEETFEAILPDENSPTYAGEWKLFIVTSSLILTIMISQALEQYKKLVLDLEIRLEKKLNEGRGTKNLPNPRLSIPDDVKMFVWKRDQGKCVKCGSQTNLEFDHIIPVSKGGSNTARNIQLLCESCNRKKSDKI